MASIKLLILLMLTGFSVGAQALSVSGDSAIVADLCSDRPGISESPQIVPMGYIQIESGFNYQRDETTGNEEEVITYNSSLFRYGLRKNIELRAIVEYLKSKSVDRTADKQSAVEGANAVTVGTKILICEGKGWMPSISFHGYLRLPYIGKKDFRPKHLAPSFRFSASHSISSKLALSYNLGSGWDGNSAETVGLYTVNVAYSLYKKLGFFIECYGMVPEVTGDCHGLDVGCNYIITPDLQVDLSGGVGLTEASPDGFISCGFTGRLSTLLKK